VHNIASPDGKEWLNGPSR